MAREWKPGDLAALSKYRVRAMYTEEQVTGEQMGMWVLSDGEVLTFDADEPARPLVVIDPEDREQIEQLVKAWIEKPLSDAVTRLQQALRELANPTPPKPDEPTGLGAVVEDAEGVSWVRLSDITFSADSWWRRAGGGAPYNERRSFEAIDAVRVLSEGVQP